MLIFVFSIFLDSSKMDFPNLKSSWSLGTRSKSSNAIEILTKRKMVRFFGGGGSDGLGHKSDEKSRFGFFGSVLGKFEEGRRSESDLTRKSKVIFGTFVV